MISYHNFYQVICRWYLSFFSLLIMFQWMLGCRYLLKFRRLQTLQKEQDSFWLNCDISLSEFLTNLCSVLSSRSTNLHFPQQCRVFPSFQVLPWVASFTLCKGGPCVQCWDSSCWDSSWCFLLILSTNWAGRPCLSVLRLRAVCGECISATHYRKAVSVLNSYPWDTGPESRHLYSPTVLVSLKSAEAGVS